MITDFDKKGIAAHFKKEFARCLSDNDYESALDYLLKYYAEKNDSDFHKACGMLYLQMTRNSDDMELFTMAYREFMMHIRRHSENRSAYRDLLATQILRGDTLAMLECGNWINERGFDVDEILDELASFGILFIADHNVEPPDIDGMFLPGEYGQIDPAADDGEESCLYDETEDAPQHDSAVVAGSKVIRFRGNTNDADTDATENAPSLNKLKKCKKKSPIPIRIVLGDYIDEKSCDFVKRIQSDVDRDIEFVSSEDDEWGGELDDGDMERTIFQDIEFYLHEGEETGKPARKRLADEMIRDVMRRAEEYCENENFADALKELEKIKYGDGEMIYYHALAMRAYICLVQDRPEEAETLLEDALSLRSDGALCGMLLCELYEREKRYTEIPDVLKGIDVNDFADCFQVYKMFKLILKYCEPTDALSLTKEYVDEYNILDMRRMYAQMLYNSGERKQAIKELYILSRVAYDDFNAKIFYIMARAGAAELPVNDEAPQEILAILVNNVIGATESGISEETLSSEMFDYSLEFFLTLEFRNSKRTLVKMFDTVRLLAADPRLEDKMCDALVSPYVEPIVKAVILTELFTRDPARCFLLDLSYCPVSRENVIPLADGFPTDYCAAYAFTVVFNRLGLPNLFKLAESAARNLAVESYDKRDVAYFLFLCDWKITRTGPPDDRIGLAFGYASKAAATRAYKKLNAAAEKITYN